MDDDPPRRTRPRWVIPATIITATPVAVLGAVVGGWPGILLVGVFICIVTAITLEP